MTDFQNFKKLMRFLAERHPKVRHSPDEVHFACSLDSADNAYAHQMHYPCVALDLGDMRLDDETTVDRSIVLIFLQHVSDTGSEQERDAAFDLTGDIAIDFLAQLAKLSDSETCPNLSFLRRLSLAGTEMARVELEEAGLYGWLVSMSSTFSLSSVLCHTDFGTDFPEALHSLFCPVPPPNS